jgi:hypothetical protein
MKIKKKHKTLVIIIISKIFDNRCGVYEVYLTINFVFLISFNKFCLLIFVSLKTYFF